MPAFDEMQILMKVFLDDERIAPEGWIQVRWPDEAIKLLETGIVTHLSLDHDLGDDERGTGYDVLLWLEKEVVLNKFVPPKNITVHSANPAARIRMLAAIESIQHIFTEVVEQQMSPELTENLYAAFPRLFRGHSNPDTSMCRGFECDDSWYQMIWDLSKQLTDYMNLHPEIDVEVTQVKTKFGTLRYRIKSGNEEIYQMIEKGTGGL